MAKYDVTMSCGHVQTIQLFGKMTDRDKKIAWLEKYGLCDECYKAETERQHAEETAKSAEKAIAEKLPELTGTEKQVNWALTIRANILAQIDKKIEDNKSRMDAEMLATAELQAKAIKKVLAKFTEARFWIDNRENCVEWIIRVNKLQDEIKAEIANLTVEENAETAMDVEDDGSNEDTDAENAFEFVASLDTSIDEDDNEDELIDPPAEVTEIENASVETANEETEPPVISYDADVWTSKNDNGAMKYTFKTFSTATAAYKWLLKKRRRYAGTTSFRHVIEKYEDGISTGEIYSYETDWEEETTDADIQALIDEENFNADARIFLKECTSYAKFKREEVDAANAEKIVAEVKGLWDKVQAEETTQETASAEVDKADDAELTAEETHEKFMKKLAETYGEPTTLEKCRAEFGVLGDVVYNTYLWVSNAEPETLEEYQVAYGDDELGIKKYNEANGIKHGVDKTNDADDNAKNLPLAYNLGKVFATLQHIINVQTGDLTVYAAKTGGPGTLCNFPLIELAGLQHKANKSLVKIKSRNADLSEKFERELCAVYDLLPADLPHQLTYDAQNDFVLGYHHQAKFMDDANLGKINF